MRIRNETKHAADPRIGTEIVASPNPKDETQMEATDGTRTHDLTLTKGVLYH